jgi:hypothetical protein
MYNMSASQKTYVTYQGMSLDLNRTLGRSDSDICIAVSGGTRNGI